MAHPRVVNLSISVGGGQQGWLAFALRRQRSRSNRVGCATAQYLPNLLRGNEAIVGVSTPRRGCGTQGTKSVADHFNPLAKAPCIARVALPDRLNPPAYRLKLPSVPLISSDIGCELGSPIVATRLGTRCQFAARMLMSEAAVNKTTSLCFGSTMSGFPGKSRRCSRNRNPIARPKT